MSQELAPKLPKAKSREQAQSILMRQCARAERCSSDALRSMHRWGVAPGEAREVLAYLQRERFIDDERYASAYVREKMRLSGWGPRKIAAQLRAKQIAPEIVARAMAQLEPERDMERLEQVLRRKLPHISWRNPYDLRAKLVRFGLSRGFAMDDVMSLTEQILRESDL
ncbi:MAG: RecX family transcriptional regulator [Tidjanibacter sp.]|nr:RecX family transcriptional regulator [Tidjanibacter sp.]